MMAATMWRPLLHRLMYGVVTSSSAMLAGGPALACACPATAAAAACPRGSAESAVDEVLHGRDGGVESALLYAKAWSKYTKELLGWVDKRLATDIECAKSYAKMAESAKNLASQQEFMPFRDIYMCAFRNDIEYSQVLLQTAAALQSNKFMQPLQTRKSELDRLRKDVKEQWQREQKKMNEAEGALRKAKLLQAQRLEEHDKAKMATGRVEEELAAGVGVGGGSGANNATAKQLEKRRRLEDEALQKAEEAREHCKACQVEVGERRVELARVKMEVITTLREMVFQCDLTLKAVTVNWFQLQHAQVVSLPVNHQSLCENAKLYDPGQRYVDYIRGLPSPRCAPAPEGQACDAGVTAAHSTGMLFTKRALGASLSSHANLSQGSQGSQGSLTSDLLSGDEVDSPAGHMTRGAKTCNSAADVQGLRMQGPFRPWSTQGGGAGGGGGGGMCSDSESAGGSSESRSMDSPTASPGDFKRRLPRTPSTGTMSSADDLDDREPSSPCDNGLSEMVMESASSPGPFRNTQMSKAAQTHKLRKLRAPSKCRECDSLVVFHGAECEECSLACHKKCLETLAIQCGHKKLAGRLHLFGIDFTQAARDSPDGVPFIIRKCTSEIENRALNIKGIYRVNGAKSRVEKLCQAFENGKDLVELSDLYPHDISNVLKLYLRQLPEPLILFRYYADFIGLAKEAQRVIVEEVEAARTTATPLTPQQVGGLQLNRVLFKLKDLLRQLPLAHYRTLQFLLEHLHRVTERAEENKMTASNLGIIFGPTLIKPRQADQAEVSLSSLVDYPYQALMVELLIRHYQMVFDAPLSPLGGPAAASPPLTEPPSSSSGGTPAPRLTAQDKQQQLSRHSKSLGDIKEQSSKVYKRHSSAVPSSQWLAEVQEATPPSSEGRGFEPAPEDVDSVEAGGRVNGVYPGEEVQTRSSGGGGGGGLARSGHISSRVHLRHHPARGKLSSSRPLSAPGRGNNNSTVDERNARNGHNDAEIGGGHVRDDSIEEVSESDVHVSDSGNNKPKSRASAHRYRSTYIDTQTLRRTWDRQYKHCDVAKTESVPMPENASAERDNNSCELLSRSVPSPGFCFVGGSSPGSFGESLLYPPHHHRPPQYAVATAPPPPGGRRTLRREDNVDGPLYSPVKTSSPTPAFRASRTLQPPPGTFYKPPPPHPSRRLGGSGENDVAAGNKAPALEKSASASASAEDEDDEDIEEDDDDDDSEDEEEELGIEIELSVDEPLEDEEEAESPSSSPDGEEELGGGGGGPNQANKPLYQRLRPRRLQEVEHREAHFV